MHYKQEECVSLFPRPGNHMSANKTQHIEYFATLLKMKRDKWFLNSPSKWNMLKGLKNIYDWYLILTFPTAIFLKVHAHYRHELVFFWRFSRPRGGAHYTTLNTVDFWCFNATFNNISAISWRPILVVEEAGENHRPWASNWQTLSLVAASREHLLL